MVYFVKYKIRQMALLAVLGLGILLPRSANSATISEVLIEGNKRIETQVIREQIHVKPGDVFEASQINADLQRLYQQGFFDDISFSLQGRVLTVTVKERPTIVAVEISGNKKLDEDEIREVIQAKAFTALNPNLLKTDSLRIKARYEQDGYYLAEIKTEIKKVSDETAEVTFKISENKKISIRKIQFEGNHFANAFTLRRKMSTKRWNITSFVTHAGTYDEALLKSDIQRLVYYYHDHGYLDVKIGQPDVKMSDDKKHFYINISISEGNPYRVGKVEVAGDLIFPKSDLEKGLLLQKEKTFRRSIMDKDLDHLSERYQDEGFFYVAVRTKDHMDPEQRVVDITYDLDKGQKVFVEKINVGGNTVTRENVIRRELLLNEQDQFSRTKFDKGLGNLKRLGYFEEVNPATPRGSNNQFIDINLDVKEKSTGTFNIGAGYSSSDKILFSAQISKDNFFGRGWAGDISANVSAKRQLFNLSVSDRHFLDSDFLVGASIYRSSTEYDDFDRTATGGGVRIGRNIWELIEGSIGYGFENVQISNVDPAVSSFFTDGITSKITAQLTRDDRDDRINPKKGNYENVSLEWAGGILGGENEFYRVRGNARAYFPLFKDISYRIQGRIGYVGPVNGKEVPVFERFFLGGLSSIRGFRARSIGPTRMVSTLDPRSGDYEFTIGGNKELVVNHEIVFPLVPPVKIEGLVFFDLGNAYDNGKNFDLTDLKMSYGFGARWQTILGPLRFEWGFPINRDLRDDVSSFEFSIGSSF